MGKHLDHLVDQTEKFSTAIALDIQVKGAVNPFEPATVPEKKPAPLITWKKDEQTPAPLHCFQPGNRPERNETRGTT